MNKIYSLIQTKFPHNFSLYLVFFKGDKDETNTEVTQRVSGMSHLHAALSCLLLPKQAWEGSCCCPAIGASVLQPLGKRKVLTFFSSHPTHL